MSFEFLRRVPTPQEHRLLAESVGWHDAFAWEALPASLSASVAGVVVLHEGQPIGMGRVVGDGAFYFYVQDVVVCPERQGIGIGTVIVESLIEQVEQIAPPKSFIGLFAAGGAAALYERHGFAARSGMTGMFRVVQQAAVPAG
ncbi:MAG TPA: GNAT family N-acetyltransferase [Nocardioidaceae bacterium]|nr:GNAT family N-acetyltransferase [Nocardioidaceae bacterium]